MKIFHYVILLICLLLLLAGGWLFSIRAYNGLHIGMAERDVDALLAPAFKNSKTPSQAELKQKHFPASCEKLVVYRMFGIFTIEAGFTEEGVLVCGYSGLDD